MKDVGYVAMVCSLDGDELGGDAVPGISFAKEFYAKYELKEVLGRYGNVRSCHGYF